MRRLQCSTTQATFTNPSFFSVRRLLGSRQVVTQCLCQLNELCSVMHHSLFGVSKKSRDLYAVQVVQVRCNHRKQETSENQKGATNQTQQNKKSTKNNKQEKPHYRRGQDSSVRIPATYVLMIKPCM